MEPCAPLEPYGNWESAGLDGHTYGHYLSALAHMIASGNHTPQGELRRRLGSAVGNLRSMLVDRGGPETRNTNSCYG